MKRLFLFSILAICVTAYSDDAGSNHGFILNSPESPAEDASQAKVLALYETRKTEIASLVDTIKSDIGSKNYREDLITQLDTLVDKLGDMDSDFLTVGLEEHSDSVQDEYKALSTELLNLKVKLREEGKTKADEVQDVLDDANSSSHEFVEEGVQQISSILGRLKEAISEAWSAFKVHFHKVQKLMSEVDKMPDVGTISLSHAKEILEDKMKEINKVKKEIEDSGDPSRRAGLEKKLRDVQYSASSDVQEVAVRILKNAAELQRSGMSEEALDCLDFITHVGGLGFDITELKNVAERMSTSPTGEPATVHVNSGDPRLSNPVDGVEPGDITNPDGEPGDDHDPDHESGDDWGEGVTDVFA